ncbi:MAG: DUF4056 domain-containing protein [Marinilabiliales bacterium]|nr:DUF4056 domain-containing protein [Marinilabiliales bacterium]
MLPSSNRLVCLAFLLIFAGSLAAKAPVFTEKDYQNHPPRIIRTCCALGTDLKVSVFPFYRYTMLTSIGKLGPHKFLGDSKEHNGILYPRRGGFLDLGHLRDLIDWTAYVYNQCKRSQITGEVVIHLGYEAGSKVLYLKVPPTEKDEELIRLAGRVAYDLSIWHEITSWFGASAVPLVSERFSSFSPEDAFSNLTGITIAAEAIRSELPYEEAVTKLITKTLKDLEAVNSDEESYQAMEAVREVWWTRTKHLPNNRVTLQRELGVYDPMLPWLVPGMESLNSTPFTLTVPETTTDGVPLHEFYNLTFDLNHKIPVHKIFPERKERVVTQRDFPEIIRFIANDMAREKIIYKY